jgi:hypothetical protein
MFFIRSQVRKNILLFFKSKFDNKFPHSYIRFTNGFLRGLPPDKYGNMIANSKIVLCPTGVSSKECFRHYEAMRAGCVIISERLPETYFYKDSPIIQIDNWKEGLAKAHDLINDDRELEKISRKTYEWWEERCSEFATAKYMKMCLEKSNTQEK